MATHLKRNETHTAYWSRLNDYATSASLRYRTIPANAQFFTPMCRWFNGFDNNYHAR